MNAGAARAAITVDSLVTANQGSAATSITSPALSTAGRDEVLVAFITSDGPSTAAGVSFSSVTGAGVTWRLRRRVNAQFGTSEIWQAVAPSPVTSASVRATRSSGSWAGSITVVALAGADPMADGATAAASASTGAPGLVLTSTRAGSWTWGVGNDWDRATPRTVGSAQTKVAEYLATAGDTFWVQRRTDPTAASNTALTLDDTGPTTDRWNLAAVEILPAGFDTSPPTTPSGLKAVSAASTSVALSWTASTDAYGVAGYRILRDGVQVGDVAGTTFSDTTVSPGTTVTYTVRAYDAARNVSGDSNAVTVTVPVPDSVPPTAVVASPTAGATVSGTTTVTATATDDVAVAGAQFLLDDAPLGSEDTAAPYSVSWDTVASANGPHVLRVRARDSSGNTTTSASVSVMVSNGSSGAAQVGQWGPLVDLPAIAIHSALTPAGKVLLWQGDFSVGGMQYVLDPSTNAITQVPDAAVDLFCSGQAVLADGRILAVGGTATSGGLGIPDVTAFDWRSQTWQALAPMHYPRWYATATTLADGSVLASSGSNRSSTDIVPIPEIYSPKTNTWRDLTAASRAIPFYPFISQLPDGRVAMLGASEEGTAGQVLDLTTNQWSTFDSRILDGGSVANYAPGKFLKAGSASDGGFAGQSTASAYTLDMNQSGATWRSGPSMASARSFLNLTNLPDGTVLATGGGTDKSGYVDANAVLTAESWNPSSGQWSTYAAMARPRLYHSVAVLLPDGRVYVAGGGSDPGVTNQRTAQMFSPPYLFKGPRPTISSAPDTVRWGTRIPVTTPDAASITKVSLIRTGSVTHAFDENARAMDLTFTQTANGLDVQMPTDGNLAPPGYYMLFLVDGKGVPSVAAMVRFPAPYEDSQPPTAPANLAGTGKLGGADLTWTAATDDVAVTRYDVHRSSTQGFTPTTANKVGQSSTTSFGDSGVPAGTFYYRVTALDAAGNVSAPSNEVPVTVRADTTPPTPPTNLRGSISGQTATISWDAATDDVGVTGYRVLRDGTVVGTASTATTYTDPGLTSGKSYAYTVVARDAAGNVSAASNAVTLLAGASVSLALDKVVTTKQATAARTIASPALSTTQPGELLVAFLASDGPSGSGTQSFSGVTGGGLTWTLRRRANGQPGSAEIWQAVAPGVVSTAVITATRASGTAQGMITVAAFVGADTTYLGALASKDAATGAPSATLTTTRAGSWVWGVGDDWDRAIAHTPGPGQTKVDEFLAPVGDTFWVQRRTDPTPASGTPVTVDDTAPTTDRWNLALIEIPAAGSSSDTTPPAAQLTAPADGATLSLTVNLSATATDNVGVSGVQFLLDGNPLGPETTLPPYTVSWNTSTAANGTHLLSARARDAAGNVNVAGSVSVTVANSTTSVTPTLDPSTPAADEVLNNVPSTASLPFSPPAGSVLYAVLSMDSPAQPPITTVASITNSGTPLTWRLLGRENHSNGTSVGGFVEVWWAANPSARSQITATATFSRATKDVAPPVGDFQILVMDNAALDQSTAAWSPNWLIDSKDNAPTATVTTTTRNSRVFGVFDNWDNSQRPLPGADQSIMSIVLNDIDRDGYWLQQKNTGVVTPGAIQLSATDPGVATEWHALAWEVLAAP